MKTCDWCGEDYDEDELYLTRCGLSLCGLCYEDHNRQGCDFCAYEEGFEAADYYWDRSRGT